MRKKAIIALFILLLFLVSSLQTLGIEGYWNYIGEQGTLGKNAAFGFVYANESGTYIISIGGDFCPNVVRTDVSDGTSVTLGPLVNTWNNGGVCYDDANRTFWIVGGFVGGWSESNIVWGFSLDNNTCWNTGATTPLTCVKWGRNGVWYNGVAYYFGGAGPGDDDSLGWVLAYNPANNTCWHEDTLGHAGGIRTPGTWYDGYSDTCYIAGGADGGGYIDEIRAYCFTNKTDWVVGTFARPTPSAIMAGWNDINKTWLAGPTNVGAVGCDNISEFDPTDGWSETLVNNWPLGGGNCAYATGGVDNSSADKHFYFFLGECGDNLSIYELVLNTSANGESDFYFIDINGGTNGTTIYDSTPTFNWTIVANTIQYHLQVATDNIFTSLVVDLNDINEINYPTEYSEPANVSFILPAANALPGYGRYYCRVRAYSK